MYYSYVVDRVASRKGDNMKITSATGDQWTITSNQREWTATSEGCACAPDSDQPCHGPRVVTADTLEDLYVEVESADAPRGPRPPFGLTSAEIVAWMAEHAVGGR